MKTVLSVAGIALVIIEFCTLVSDKPLAAALSGLVAVACLIPIWYDERVTAVEDARRMRSPHGASFPFGGLIAVKPSAAKPSVPSRRPALRPVRPARAA